MQDRLRLLRGATALLYFGPLLAGLGGFGWLVVPVFVAIFLLWLFIMRPQQWPQSRADWSRSGAVTALAAQAAVQVLLVVLCFGIGRGIGGALGALPPFPLMLPIAISFLSIPICRMLWNPWQAEALDGIPDTALAEGAAALPADSLRLRPDLASRMVEELGGLPKDTPDEVLAQHLGAMAVQVDQAALRVALMDPIYDGAASGLHWRAAVVHATDPQVVRVLAGEAYPRAVFAELAEAAHLELFAARCRDLLVAWPGALPECPEATEVLKRVGAFPAADKALKDLAGALAVAS